MTDSPASEALNRETGVWNCTPRVLIFLELLLLFAVAILELTERVAKGNIC